MLLNTSSPAVFCTIGKLLLVFYISVISVVQADIPGSSYLSYNKNSLALLSGTLRTYQKAACDETWIHLRCPEGTTISIQYAQYGRTASSPTLCHSSLSADLQVHSPSSNNRTCLSQKAKEAVVTLCQKKFECKFQVRPRTFGEDPCRYSPKFFEVAYKCRPSQFKSVSGCEHDIVQLTCNPGSRLAIYSANFGRTEFESLQCPQPARVPEETCLASYATETVMHMCHGKRKCSIRAESSTFGRPCKPASRMYLKVIHTCVPRKVLKAQYRGELESDETEDVDNDEFDDGTNVWMSGLMEHSSVSSSSRPSAPDLSISTDVSRQDEDEIARSSAILNVEENLHAITMSKDNSHDTPPPSVRDSDEDVRLIRLISQGMSVYEFASRNSETLLLLVAVSLVSVFLLLLMIALARLLCSRRRQKKAAKEEKRRTTSTIRRASGLSDIDELSLVMEPNEYIHLSTLPRRNNASSSFCGSSLCKSKVVRYSNSRDAMLGREEEADENPHTFHQQHESDMHFVFG